jgi:UDP-glucose:(heptosyl)LPS alpha-1,3-glucosyltransferase
VKLAFCLFNYFPFGGLQRDFFRIAKECVRRGHSVDVYTMQWEGEKDPQIPVTEIVVSGLQNHTRSHHFVTQLQPYLTQHQYDLVVGFNKMPGLDVYYAADTCYQAKARQQRNFWYRWLPRYQHLVAYEKAVFAEKNKTTILLISDAQQPEFQRFYHTEKNRFHLLPPGIARDRVAPPNANEIRQALRQEFRLQEQDILLLMVGSGFKTKGLDRTLEAVAALPEKLKSRTRLFVIGQDHAEKFQQHADKLGISKIINFLGGRSDVPRFLLAADLLLHPAYNENTGTVLLEALVSGLPVIATDVCGYAHYVEEARAGIVLSSPFEQAYFNKILADVLSSLPRLDWQQNALEFAKNADIYSLPQRAVDVIETLNKKATS